MKVHLLSENWWFLHWFSSCWPSDGYVDLQVEQWRSERENLGWGSQAQYVSLSSRLISLFEPPFHRLDSSHTTILVSKPTASRFYSLGLRDGDQDLKPSQASKKLHKSLSSGNSREFFHRERERLQFTVKLLNACLSGPTKCSLLQEGQMGQYSEWRSS